MTEIWTWDQAKALADYNAGEESSMCEDLHFQITKLQEEVGEVAQAFIGWAGQNRRKGYTHSTGHIINELVDVAITAMVGIATIATVDGDDAWNQVDNATERVWRRFRDSVAEAEDR